MSSAKLSRLQILTAPIFKSCFVSLERIVRSLTCTQSKIWVCIHEENENVSESSPYHRSQEEIIKLMNI